MSKAKQILVVDDHSLIRKGITYLLDQTEDLRVVAEASSAEEALSLVHARQYDLVILDAIMPGRGGIDVIKDMRCAQPGIRIIILSMYNEEQIALNAYKEGASGFISKKDSETTLIPAIRTVLSGQRYITQTSAEYLLNFVVDGPDRPPHEKLGKRELQVLIRIGLGRPPRQIAEELALSVKTVNAHRANIMRKLELTSTAALVKYLVDHKLLS